MKLGSKSRRQEDLKYGGQCWWVSRAGGESLLKVSSDCLSFLSEVGSKVIVAIQDKERNIWDSKRKKKA